MDLLRKSFFALVQVPGTGRGISIPPASVRVTLRPRACLVALAALGLTGCGGNGPGQPAQVSGQVQVNIEPKAMTITQGRHRQLTARVVGATSDGTRWSALEPGVVITGEGLLTAPDKPGLYHVKAVSVADPSAGMVLAVEVVPAPVAQELKAGSDSIYPGSSVLLTPGFSGGTGVVTPDVGTVTSGQPVQVSPVADTVYVLRVTNEAGETQELSRKIKVLSHFEQKTSGPAKIEAADLAPAGSVQTAWVRHQDREDRFRWELQGGTFLGPEASPSTGEVVFRVDGAAKTFTLRCQRLPKPGTEAPAQLMHTGKVLDRQVAAGGGSNQPVAAGGGSNQPVATVRGSNLVGLTPDILLDPYLTEGKDGCTAAIADPKPDMKYVWQISPDTGTFTGPAAGPTVTFRTGAGPGSVTLSVTATHHPTGAVFRTVRSAMLSPKAVMPRIVIAGNPAPGSPILATVEGGQAREIFNWGLSKGATFQGGGSHHTGPSAIVIITGTDAVTLSCTAVNLAGEPSDPAHKLITPNPSLAQSGMPPMGGVPGAPPVEGASGAPPVEGIPEAPPVEGIPEAPPVEGIPDAPPMEGIPEAPPMDGGPDETKGELKRPARGPEFILAFTAQPLKVELGERGNLQLNWKLATDPLANPTISWAVRIAPDAIGKNNPKSRLLPFTQEVEKTTEHSLAVDLGGLRRRETFTLTARGKLGDLPAKDFTRTASVGVRSVSVLAGDGRSIAEAYLGGLIRDPGLFPDNGAERSTAAYRHVTGMAWAQDRGELFFAEGRDQTIRRVDRDGRVTAFLGSRGRPDEGGLYPSRAPRLNQPGPLGIMAVGTGEGKDPRKERCLIIADQGSLTLKAVPLTGANPDGEFPMQILAGLPGQKGDQDGNGSAARFKDLTAMAVLPDQETIFLIDNQKIRMVKDRVVRTIDPDDRPLVAHNLSRLQKAFKRPDKWELRGIAVDPHRLVVYVTEGNAILKLTPSAPGDMFNSTWTASCLVGDTSSKTEDGPFDHAHFTSLAGCALEGDDLYVVEPRSNAIRKVSLAGQEVTTVMGSGGDWEDEDLAMDEEKGRLNRNLAKPGVLVPGRHGILFVADQEQTALRRIAQLPGQPVRILTWGVKQGSGLAAPAKTVLDPYAEGHARLRRPMGIGADEAGNIYLADEEGQAILKIGPKGNMDLEVGVLDQRRPKVPEGERQQLDAPMGLSVLPDGQAFLLERNARTFFKLAKGANGGIKADRQPLVLPHHARLAVYPPAPAGMKKMQPPFVLFSGEDDTGEAGVWVGWGPRQELVAWGRAEAFAADRNHNVYTLSYLPRTDEDKPSPTLTLTVTRYKQPPAEQPGAETWIAEACLQPFKSEDLDARNCGVPDIQHMTLDSRGNLYLADSGNGIIWRIPKELDRCDQIAGHYPYLGYWQWGEDRGLDQPLYAFNGFAATAQDDLVFTMGRAAYQLTAPGLPGENGAEPALGNYGEYALRVPQPVDPDPGDAADQALRARGAQKVRAYGFKVGSLPNNLRHKLRIPAEHKPIVVTDVEAGTGAARAKLKRGSVIEGLNGTPLNGLSGFFAAVLADGVGRLDLSLRAPKAAHTPTDFGPAATVVVTPVVDPDPPASEEDRQLRAQGARKLLEYGFKVVSLDDDLRAQLKVVSPDPGQPAEGKRVPADAGRRLEPAVSAGARPVMVAEVRDHTGAREAGLKVGSVIYQLGGVDTEGLTGFFNRVLAAKDGRLDLMLRGPGHDQVLGPVAELGIVNEPDPVSTAVDQMNRLYGPGELKAHFGFSVVSLPSALRDRLAKLSPEDKPVVVATVEQDSPAQKAGLPPGCIIFTVNGQKTGGLSGFFKMTRKVGPGRLTLEVATADAPGKRIVVKIAVGEAEE